MNPWQRHITEWGLLLLIAVLSASGCDDKRRHQTTDATNVAMVAAPVSAEASPGDVVRALLDAVRDAQKTRAVGLGSANEKKRYDQAMGKLRYLVARRAIHQALSVAGQSGVPKDITPEAAATLATESWVSILAHYVDGFLYNTLQVRPGFQEGLQETVVWIEAEHPDDARRIAALTDSPQIREARDATGNPITPRTRDWIARVKAEAMKLDPPLAYPVRARIEVHLKREDDVWRVYAVRIGPPAPNARSISNPPNRSGEIAASQPKAASYR